MFKNFCVFVHFSVISLAYIMSINQDASENSAKVIYMTYFDENNIEPNTSETPADETPAAENPTGEFAAGSGEYHYIRPEATRRAYSDAAYIPSADAGAVPKRYHCSESFETPKKKKKTRSGMPAAAVVALCLVCAILGGLGGGAIAGTLVDKNESSTASNLPASSETIFNVAESSGKSEVVTNVVASGEVLSANQIYSLACSQVVAITSEISYASYFGYQTAAVSGSGFVISSDGYILTNYHVIEDAASGGYEITVHTYDGSEYTASVVGYEADNDVAVLKIEAEGLSAVTLGDSSTMNVGDAIYAVGNPLGTLQYTMTSGMVSALDRDITSYDSSTGSYNTINMFQIDAAVNSGNSGGPVYNDRGQVIGIVTAKYSDTGVEGLGFAVPINDAVAIANDLITKGYVSGKAYMGISVDTLPASVSQYYGLPYGAYVVSVTEGSCAEKAGLVAGDIITAMDDIEITSGDDLISAKKGYRAGDTATLYVSRSGETLELSITFDEEVPTETEAESEASQSESRQQPGYGFGFNSGRGQ